MEYLLVVDVRNQDNEKYIRKDGNKTSNFVKSLTKLQTDKEAEELCKSSYLDYNSITNSENIEVTILYRSTISNTFVPIYTYYGDLDRFIKH